MKYKLYPMKFLTQTKDGISKNISQAGLLFKVEKPIPLGSVIWLQLDYKTLEICREIEEGACFCKNGFLAKVVRVEENPGDGMYSIGVCFLIKEETPLP